MFLDQIPGKLQMLSAPVNEVAEALSWIDYLSNKILIVIALVWVLLKLSDIFRIWKQILFSISRARGSSSMEYNISASRMRNSIAIAFVLPFCLISDCYALYAPQFVQSIDRMWSVGVSIAALLAYILLRLFLFSLVRLPKVDQSYKEALLRGPYGLFFVMVLTMIASAGVICIAKVDLVVARTVLLYEMAFFFALHLIRSFQILRMNYSVLLSFLYLCALEIIPITIMVASTVFL